MANTYSSTHTGAQIDAFDSRINTNESNIATINTDIVTINNNIQQLRNDVFDIAHPVGSVICMSTNEYPDIGEWTLIDKELALISYSSGQLSPTLNTTNCSAATVGSAWAEGHDIFINISLTTKVALTDDAKVLCTIDPTALGCSTFGQGRNLTFFSDAGNAVIGFNLNAAGQLSVVDVMARGSSTASLAAQALTAYTLYFSVRHDCLLDASCNKFYFKRTA